jgi:Chaperone of endosialidase
LALYSNTTGSYNTATGDPALVNNATGNNNTATGHGALGNPDFSVAGTGIGNENTANGYLALENNTAGDHNVAVGSIALANNGVGVANTAVGWGALQSNTDNGNSTAVGAGALANSTGFANTALGVNAGVNLTDGFKNIDIGNQGVAGESNTIRIGDVQGATFVAGITKTAVVGTAVVVNGNGQLGTVGSSQRFKDEVKPMDKTSEAILALKPVTFHYKKELDPKGIPQFGLVAEDVEKVNPDLVARDADGKVYTVRYEAVNAMLLNEFLKQHRTVQEQQKEIDALRAELKEQRALIQKVNDKVELNRPAPQTVLNNQ